jgi:hypothetical protein
MTHKIILPFILGLAAAMIAGCGGSGVQLRGTVTFSEDGLPVNAGTVCFVAGNSISRGDLQEDGTYRVGTNKPGDGIPPGTYTVYIINTEKTEEIPIGNEGNFIDRTVQTVHRKYTSPSTSGITVTVDRSTKTFDFQVERYSGR